MKLFGVLLLTCLVGGAAFAASAQKQLPVKKPASVQDSFTDAEAPAGDVEGQVQDEPNPTLTEDALCLHNINCGSRGRPWADSKGCLHCGKKPKKRD